LDKLYDVYGLGNALVDTEVQVEEAILTSQKLEKGLMSLVSQDYQEQLLTALDGHHRMEAAGGSAANTMVGVALFGGSAFYTGKVGSDMAGALYRESMAEVGVEFDVEADSGPTGTCLILVTPDGERTMQTSLGSSTSLGAADVDAARLASSRMLYIEGYLWGGPNTKAAAIHAMELANAAKVPVALSFSDPGIMQHAGDAIRKVTKEYVDIVFCNEHEARLYSGAGSREDALKQIGQDCPMVFMTCGGDGSLVHNRGKVAEVAPHRVPVVDTTGAGDVYAAGVVFGLTHGMTPEQAGVLGSYASAKIVTALGPRLNDSLVDQVDAILSGAHPLE
jgi:sugar/nucleoside kinase (ribokinase family)